MNLNQHFNLCIVLPLYLEGLGLCPGLNSFIVAPFLPIRENSLVKMCLNSGVTSISFSIRDLFYRLLIAL